MTHSQLTPGARKQDLHEILHITAALHLYSWLIITVVCPRSTRRETISLQLST